MSAVESAEEEEEDEPVWDDVQEINLSAMKTKQSPTAIVLSGAENVIRIENLPTARGLWQAHNRDYNEHCRSLRTFTYALQKCTCYLGSSGNEADGTCMTR
jgi:hypothetical protein